MEPPNDGDAKADSQDDDGASQAPTSQSNVPHVLHTRLRTRHPQGVHRSPRKRVRTPVGVEPSVPVYRIALPRLSSTVQMRQSSLRNSKGAVALATVGDFLRLNDGKSSENAPYEIWPESMSVNSVLDSVLPYAA